MHTTCNHVQSALRIAASLRKLTLAVQHATLCVPGSASACCSAAVAEVSLCGAEGVPVIGSAEAPFVPMQVVGSVREQGLGLVSWWE